MSFKVTLIVESTHGDSENTMRKTIEAGSDNERFYPSQVQHVGVTLLRWAEDTMTSLVGGRDNTLVDHDVKMIVHQRVHLAALEQVRAFCDLEKANAGWVFISKDALKELSARDALLSAMEAAGVDNWEGMDNVVRPDD